MDIPANAYELVIMVILTGLSVAAIICDLHRQHRDTKRTARYTLYCNKCRREYVMQNVMLRCPVCARVGGVRK